MAVYTHDVDGVLKKSIKSPDISPSRMIFWGFIVIILIGALLLSLPISSVSGSSTGFIDALFTSTSAVCVTGLAVVDTNTHWSLFGKVVLLVLTQVGALGVMSVITLFYAVTGHALNFNQRMAIKESISNFSLENIAGVFQKILKVALAVEGIGAVIIAIDLIPKYGFVSGVGKSIFQAVSAFCNAGFDLFGTENEKFVSLMGFSDDYIMLLVTASLIIIGGLGFIIWDDIVRAKKFSRLALNTKVVLVMTFILLVMGTFTYLIFEANNTMKDFPLQIKILNAFFHSASDRTAGFNTLAINNMDAVSCLITIVLMFIGAAPGSTAGGVKVTTFFVLFLTVVAFLSGRKDVQAFEKRISYSIVNKAVAIFILNLLLVLVTTAVLLINKEGSLLQTLFEATSAFGTVGLSTGITPDLCASSKIQLVLTMIFGRVGTITVFTSFLPTRKKENITYRYPEGKITVG